MLIMTLSKYLITTKVKGLKSSLADGHDIYGTMMITGSSLRADYWHLAAVTSDQHCFQQEGRQATEFLSPDVQKNSV